MSMDVTFFENKLFFSNTHLQGETSSEDSNDDLLFYDVVPVHSMSQNEKFDQSKESETVSEKKGPHVVIILKQMEQLRMPQIMKIGILFL